MKRLLIKIGSSVLAKEGGLLDRRVAESLVEDVAELKAKFDVVIVTSGAVSLGRNVGNFQNFKVDAHVVRYSKKIVLEQVLAAIGQPRLMAFYTNRFGVHGITCAQILATRSDFADRERYRSLRTVTENLIRLGAVPIFNENDVLSPEELDFSDNDQLAYMVAAMLGVDEIIILSNVDGVYNGSPKDPQSRVVSVISDPDEFMEKVDSSLVGGKGGMRSKLQAAKLVTSLGISVRIANGSHPRIISRIQSGEQIGTYFPSNASRLKARKSWIATAASSNGKIVVSTFLADILRKKQAASVLLNGIEGIEGNFHEKEVVEICDEEGVVLGRGISRSSAEDLRRKVKEYGRNSDLGKVAEGTNAILAIHYDNLVLL